MTEFSVSVRSESIFSSVTALSAAMFVKACVFSVRVVDNRNRTFGHEVCETTRRSCQ